LTLLISQICGGAVALFLSKCDLGPWPGIATVGNVGL